MSDSRFDIRPPAWAGKFYPKSPGELTKTIATMFSETKKAPVQGHPRALIVPHAGYIYSGNTAAHAYKMLEGEQFDTVVIISPSHYVFFRGSSVYDGGGYRTPLGEIATDFELSARIADINPSVYLSNQGHASGSTRGEHALEVQLPFLQVVLGQFKLVAIVMGEQEGDNIRGLGETLASALKGTNSLIVASSDLSHQHPVKIANRMDGTVRTAIEKYDPQMLIDTLESGRGEACGGGPMAAAMIAAKRLGAGTMQFLHYTTSGETTGDFDDVVGYLSAVMVAEKKAVSTSPTMGAMPARMKKPGLTDEDRQCLLKIAKDAIASHLSGREYEPTPYESLQDNKGAFVTITLNGKLRGCIGQIRAVQPLYKTISGMAVAAAFEDPRFPKLTPVEFLDAKIEISVLSHLERVHDFGEIKVGRDGLLVKLELHTGLLLPQVATENGWGVTEFLQQTCLKAGLPMNSYKKDDVEIYRFSAEVF
ncbi:MAG: AmmeMemoRadiSam system protein B [candidate division Zixibacteria bacterium]|nr:AmmeMemoRadiSam system protein B [candidate division Zixibacteria bacterium]